MTDDPKDAPQGLMAPPEGVPQAPDDGLDEADDEDEAAEEPIDDLVKKFPHPENLPAQTEGNDDSDDMYDMPDDPGVKQDGQTG